MKAKTQGVVTLVTIAHLNEFSRLKEYGIVLLIALFYEMLINVLCFFQGTPKSLVTVWAFRFLYSLCVASFFSLCAGNASVIEV